MPTNMQVLATGALVIGAGLGLMAFGLFLFYTFLPLFYGIFGAALGYRLGMVIMGHTMKDAGLIEFILAIALAVAAALAAYYLEPFRRALGGILVGGLLGLTIGDTLQIGQVIHLIIGTAGAIIGALLALWIYDTLIVIASALAGAAMVMDGTFLLLPGIALLDRNQIFWRQSWLPLVVWIAITAAGAAWQFANLRKWSAVE
jgi:hypothetical protein